MNLAQHAHSGTRWQAHVNRFDVKTPGVNAAARAWLTDTGSLTAKLTACSRRFRVQKLHQKISLCLRDEAKVLGLSKAQQVWEREVLLQCDGLPVVFAHTVVPLSANASDWPLFSSLGERSLGTMLFQDPQVTRGALSYAALRPGHPLYRRACAALGLTLAAAQNMPNRLYARRSLYRRHNGLLLVTEVFLPALYNLIDPQLTRHPPSNDIAAIGNLDARQLQRQQQR